MKGQRFEKCAGGQDERAFAARRAVEAAVANRGIFFVVTVVNSDFAHIHLKVEKNVPRSEIPNGMNVHECGCYFI